MIQFNSLKTLFVCLFMVIGWNAQAQNPCTDCEALPFDPVCIVEQGDTITLPNFCFVECLGFDSTNLVTCNITLPPDPCNCGFIIDPVCVNDPTTGEVLFFVNACQAECEGYTSTDFVICDTNPGGGNDCQADFAFGLSNDSLEITFFDLSTASSAITSWLWDFGDGNTSTDQNPTHTYAVAGEYDVTLTIASDSCESTVVNLVFVDNFVWEDCYVSFSYDQPDPAVNTIEFTEESWVTNGTGTVISWSWDFGDGNTSTDQNPTHTYADQGDYTVTLSITTDDGCESTVDYYIHVGDYNSYPWVPEDCQAFFNFNQDPNDEMTINFEDISFTNEPITEWFWNFGDGNVSSDQNPSHTYAVEGIYPVTLTITTDSCQSNFIMLVFAGDEAWYPTTCQALFLPLFDGTTVFLLGLPLADSPIATWEWDFGDGNTSNEPFPVHTYASVGNYDITLTITTDDGCTSSFTIGFDLLDGFMSGNATQGYMLSGTTSNENITIVDKVKSYPNPATDIFNLELSTTSDKEVQININSVNGIQLSGNTYQLNAGENKVQLDVARLTSGVYFVEIVEGDQVKTIKFLK